MARGRGPDGARLVLTTPLWHRCIAVGTVLLLAAFAARSAVDLEGPLRLLFVALAFIAAAIAVRLARLRVEANDAGVRVVNLLGSRQLLWDEIQRVDYEFGVDLLLKDGREVSPDVFANWFVAPIPPLAAATEESGRCLGAELRRHRS